MTLTYVETEPSSFLEGPPDQPLVQSSTDTRSLIEACFEHDVRMLLLYAVNLPLTFFDLSSGVAGAILQTLQNYRIRLAVVCPPGSIPLSSRFHEMLAETQQSGDFGIFTTREAATAWLKGGKR